MKHTPGPWTQLDQEHAVSIVSGGIVIADVFKPDDNCVSPPMSETLDNARLIAAAPDLLTTLKAMTTILSNIQNTLAGYLTPDSTLDQDDCINAILNISDHKETLSTQRSALQLITAIEKGD